MRCFPALSQAPHSAMRHSLARMLSPGRARLGRSQPYKHPGLRLAQNAESAEKTAVREQKLPPGTEAAVAGEISVLTAAAKAEKDKEAPIPAVDEETLSLYPTAAQCGQCHKQIYEEWSSSNHAYASISPMFHAFEQKFQELTQGTVGTFCVRCHQQVGTQLGESRETPLWARSPISREGVTCITCHRVKEQYGKVNGERRVEPGKISSRSTAPARRASSKTSSPTRKPIPSRPAKMVGARTSTTA